MLNPQFEPDSAELRACQKNLVPIVGPLPCWKLCHMYYNWAPFKRPFNAEQLSSEAETSFKCHLCIMLQKKYFKYILKSVFTVHFQ